MASWEPTLVAAITRAAGGENPIEKIDHEAKVIEIKRDARVDPSFVISVILFPISITTTQPPSVDLTVNVVDLIRRIIVLPI